ncbi:MAG: hypothetical protein ACRD2U_06400 [Terriglobales bacterium]
MAASQVVLYFDRQEDALLFTLAASSVIASDEPGRTDQSALKIAKEISKASRITTEGSLNRQADGVKSAEPHIPHRA